MSHKKILKKAKKFVSQEQRRLGLTDWRVVTVMGHIQSRTTVDALEACIMTSVNGRCATLEINAQMPCVTRQLIVHELLHLYFAEFETFQRELTDNERAMKETHEHSIIRRLENLICGGRK
jgi:hypothetical protein